MRITLALGSGGARGYAHIGVIEELEARANRWTLAAVVGVVLLCIALWAGVTAAFAVALRSTLAPGWVCLISLALLGYGLFMFWWGRIRTR